MERIQKCPRFSTICSAVDGDEIAMEKILNHYNAYISKACLRPCYDEYGNMRIVVDMDLKGRVGYSPAKSVGTRTFKSGRNRHTTRMTSPGTTITNAKSIKFFPTQSSGALISTTE